jgi:hypothetical protein
MDTLIKLDQVIESVLQQTVDTLSVHENENFQIIIDADRKNFVLIMLGWEGHRRVHDCLVHIQIIHDRIWIQHDGIEDSITESLEAAGIPKNQIVLAFYPEHVRVHTGYAIA